MHELEPPAQDRWLYKQHAGCTDVVAGTFPPQMSDRPHRDAELFSGTADTFGERGDGTHKVRWAGTAAG